jgi:hypothetical protein
MPYKFLRDGILKNQIGDYMLACEEQTHPISFKKCSLRIRRIHLRRKKYKNEFISVYKRDKPNKL